jgi:Fe-S cluster assembly protein SufB/Fe-S cluster assembly protein SufD
MTKILKKYTKPGKWMIEIPFDTVGESKQWLGVIDARTPGVYELKVIANHSVQNTTGKVTVRAVAGKGSVVRIKGLIKISATAQETDDFLELRVLTLDKTVKATAEPELEIEANNVKASHSASVGQVEREQILYLMSRGLSEAQAIESIIEGWLSV